MAFQTRLKHIKNYHLECQFFKKFSASARLCPPDSPLGFCTRPEPLTFLSTYTMPLLFVMRYIISAKPGFRDN